VRSGDGSAVSAGGNDSDRPDDAGTGAPVNTASVGTTAATGGVITSTFTVVVVVVVDGADEEDEEEEVE